MYKHIWLLLFLIIITACSSPRVRRQGYETFVGIDEKELVFTLGPPDSSYELGKEKFLTYFKTGSTYVMKTDPVSNMPVGGYMPLMCKITFVFYKEKLDNWHYEGNMCNEYIQSINLH